jgi:DNA-binding transcriptional ArsR family regulator
MDNIPNVVENMPNLENITKIISLFERNIFEDYSVREISKKILLDYKTVRKTIKKLLALELIKLKIKGKSNMIALNLNHSDVKTYLSFASYFNRLLYFAQNAKLIFLLEEINRLNLFDITVVLFGSHVTGEQKKHSDLDLLLISKNI